MTTLVSFLGKSRADARTGYRVTTYRFAAGDVREVPFFGMGLLEHAQPDRLLLVGTSGSMWDVFFDHQQTDDEGTLALIDAVARDAVTPALLAVHEQRLTARLGIPVQCLLISYARDEAEQTAILSDLASHLHVGERILLDVTHGFRHLPMLALVAARYLALVQGVQVQELYYGAAEMTDPGTGETPVLRLGGMLRMLDWVQALAVYGDSGNYSVFVPLLADDGMQRQHAQLLAQGAYFERNSNPVQAKQALTGALGYLREHTGPLGALFGPQLTEHIDWFRHGTRAEWELALADRYLARQDYLRAVTYLYESFISHAVYRDKGDMNHYDDREEAFRNTPKNANVWLLKNLRNAMAHGVRSDDREIKRLLQDQAELDARLHQLRKALFTSKPFARTAP